jgi:carbamate kinase
LRFLPIYFIIILSFTKQSEVFIMENRKIVVALGRNAFGETFPEQQSNVSKAAVAIADLVEAKYQIVITHSNGPQVGMIQTAMTEFARLQPNDRTVAPMSVCGAMSEGYIGYDLQNAIREELLNRGIYKTVSTIITQVRVDPFDAAFNEPSKVIGRYMTKEEAALEEEKGNYVTEEEPGKFRRIIAAPMPIDIYEIEAVKALLDADQIVIAAGGGGIPVLQQGTHLKGASAIIEKDYAAAKLADMVGAGTLLFLTAYDKLTIEKDSANEKVFDAVSATDLHEYIKQGHFPAITTFPKVDASIRFVTSGSDRKAVISNLDKAKLSLGGKSGTTITA